MNTKSVIFGLLFALDVVSITTAGDWPAFRGPAGNGIAAQGEQPPLTWSMDKNIRWKVKLPGTGNGSPIAVNRKLYLNCAQDLGRRRTLHCFDCTSGEELWKQAIELDKIELTHISNPYCGSTPASDGKFVVTWHGTGGLHCYSCDGESVWHRSFGEIQHLWGYGSSPIIHNDRVILFSGASAKIFVACVRLADGELIWTIDEPGGQSNVTPDGDLTGSWSTPVIATIRGMPQVICAMPTAIIAVDLIEGKELWRCEGFASDRGKLVYASPLVASEIVVAMSGYMGPAFAVHSNGTGNVTQSQRVWNVASKNPQRIGSGVVVTDFVYIANSDGGTIQCLELNSGKERWRERVHGGPHWASTVYVNGLLYATNQHGITRVLRPNPNRFELVASNTLGEMINATPAFSNNEVFMRTAENLYCIAQLE